MFRSRRAILFSAMLAFVFQSCAFDSLGIRRDSEALTTQRAVLARVAQFLVDQTKRTGRTPYMYRETGKAQRVIECLSSVNQGLLRSLQSEQDRPTRSTIPTVPGAMMLENNLSLPADGKGAYVLS